MPSFERCQFRCPRGAGRTRSRVSNWPAQGGGSRSATASWRGTPADDHLWDARRPVRRAWLPGLGSDTSAGASPAGAAGLSSAPRRGSPGVHPRSGATPCCARRRTAPPLDRPHQLLPQGIRIVGTPLRPARPLRCGVQRQAGREEGPVAPSANSKPNSCSMRANSSSVGPGRSRSSRAAPAGARPRSRAGSRWRPPSGPYLMVQGSWSVSTPADRMPGAETERHRRVAGLRRHAFPL
jgi:hypothetical protein